MFTGTNLHLTDQEFFTYIKFYRLYFGLEPSEPFEQDYFSLTNLTLSERDLYTPYQNLFKIKFFQEVEVQVNFNHPSDLQEIYDEAGKYENKEDLHKTLGKVLNGEKVTISEINTLIALGFDAYNRMIFYPNTKNKKLESYFKTEINSYLDSFINNDLQINKNNYFRFEIQNKKLIELIEKRDMINLYGNKFILSEVLNGDGFLQSCSEFSIIQTCFALQKMGFIAINKLWKSTDYSKGIDLFEENYPRLININLTLKDSFIDELNDNFKSLNPNKYYESYDSEKKILNLCKKKIKLAVKGNDTDSIKLIETLLKDKEKTWHNDEILNDWGYSLDEDTSKNKIYHSAKNLNKKIEKELKISDFIIPTTKDCKINPKYLKID
jgi:hypothetical protein